MKEEPKDYKDKPAKAALPDSLNSLFKLKPGSGAPKEAAAKGTGPRAMLSACHNGEELGVVIPDLVS